jgi:DNA-binding response OmpR family regulator
MPPFENCRPLGRVLLIQESSVLREMQQASLRRAGYEVVCCSDAPEAFTEIVTAPVDVVVLNATSAAAEAADYLLALRRIRPLITVLVTPATGAAGNCELRHYDVDLVLAQPVTPQKLAEHIARLITGADRPGASPVHPALNRLPSAFDWTAEPARAAR